MGFRRSSGFELPSTSGKSLVKEQRKEIYLTYYYYYYYILKIYLKITQSNKNKGGH